MKSDARKSDTNIKIKPWNVLLINLVIVVAIIILFAVYLNSSNQKLYLQNLNDIRNINSASAEIASELSASQEQNLINIRNFLGDGKNIELGNR